jgi:pSer/pThr/pTyr-binding forkhead associated (FHA) protein
MCNMKQPPIITVQLIHIYGPLKGEIQDFSKETITIGRHPASDLKFPADLTIISRKHAEIKREGNQFRLIDRSTNGTFVNGKKITETLLRDGDVLEFADGGPKASFLTQMKEATGEAGTAPPQPEEPRQPPPSAAPRPEAAPPEISVQQAAVPLVIQYGPTIRSFKELPITMGKSLKCDFVLDHPGIFDQHAQVFFSQGQYWIKDLTGQNMIRLNQRPIPFQAALTLYDNVALSPQGPVFRFLGEGRMAELAEPAAEEPLAQSEREAGTRIRDIPDKEAPKGVISKIKKLF